MSVEKITIVVPTTKRASGFDNFSYTKSGFPVSTALVIAATMDKTDIQLTMSL